MAWKITTTNGAEVWVQDRVRTPDGFVHPSTVEVGNIICMFGDGSACVQVSTIEEIVE